MLGQDLVDILIRHGFNVIPVDIDTFDITSEQDTIKYLDNCNFNLLIHAAAYTDVDGAELNQDKAFLVNHTGTQNLARYTSKLDIPMIYISTDYVFDGNKNTPYETDDSVNPLNIYGLSKLKGEKALQENNPRYYIVRTSWLYGHRGKNFVETIINLAKQKPEIKVINDQTGCPTWTIDLSYGILNLIQKNMPYGIYHICGSNYTSWHGFAVKIIELMEFDTKILPISTKEFSQLAKRPKYSVMNNNKINPDWKESLENYIKIREKEL